MKKTTTKSSPIKQNQINGYKNESSCSTDNSSTSSSPLETIQTSISIMQQTSLTVNPHHYHSFTKCNDLTIFTTKKCALCQTRLSPTAFWKSSSSSNDVVKCIACGMYTHRSCSFKHTGMEVCPVNKDKIEKGLRRVEEKQQLQEVNVWSAQGPPSHWAMDKPELLCGLVASHSSTTEDSNISLEHSMSSVSKVLQDNVLTLFSLRSSSTAASTPTDEEQEEQEQQSEEQEKNPSNLQPNDTNNTNTTPSSPPSKSIITTAKSTIQTATDSTHAIQKLTSLGPTIGLASIAGGLAGGVAGLAVAGPVGAVIGSKIGRTCGVLGVLFEGGVSLGVLVAGCAAGVQTMQGVRYVVVQDDVKKKKVVLVRCNVSLDPSWEEMVSLVRTSMEKEEALSSPVTKKRFLFKDCYDMDVMAEKEQLHRYHKKRDEEIYKADEDEIPTADKVFVLVSRSLNDKCSFAGKVYRTLIQEFKSRANAQQEEHSNDHDTTNATCEANEMPVDEDNFISNACNTNEMSIHEDNHQTTTTCDTTEIIIHNDETTTTCDTKEIIITDTEADPPSRINDAHAVIYYITRTLFETRPKLGASSKLADLTNGAVEQIIFGEIYNSVFLELRERTTPQDLELSNKIEEVGDTLQKFLDCGKGVSLEALKTLQSLPESHSTGGKLSICVQFLELISLNYAQHTEDVMCADSLLTTVCRHILLAKLPNIFAEITFLEEFAKDSQLLKGKEGYALVTMQAALVYLSNCHDLTRDLFMDG